METKSQKDFGGLGSVAMSCKVNELVGCEIKRLNLIRGSTQKFQTTRSQFCMTSIFATVAGRIRQCCDCSNPFRTKSIPTPKFSLNSCDATLLPTLPPLTCPISSAPPKIFQHETRTECGSQRALIKQVCPPRSRSRFAFRKPSAHAQPDVVSNL